MKAKRKAKKELSRRDFIKRTAVGVGATALTGLGATGAEAAGIPRSWDKEVDVVVIGYGSTGAHAAIAAHDAGAEVIIVQNAPIGGGNSRRCGTFTQFPSDPVEEANFLYNLSGLVTPMEVCKMWGEQMVKNKAWLDQIGIKYVMIGPTMGIMQGSGPGYYAQIDALLKERGITILFDTPAEELIQDPRTKAILGVKVKSGGWDKYIKARRGVMLACGGFQFNEEMVNNYLRPYPMKWQGWKYNDGSGVKMAQKVGASLWHMNQINGHACFWFPEYEVGFFPNIPAFGAGQTYHYIFVDQYGKRFANEIIGGNHQWWINCIHYDEASKRHDRCPFYMIFDETTRLKAPIASTENAHTIPIEYGGLPLWSADNSAEIERGWIKKADTIEDLVAKIGEPLMKPEVLKATVDGWNQICAAGRDPDFGRAARTLSPIETPPYYAAPMYPGGAGSTSGGPRINEKCQVLDVDGKPIPRLYAGGELSSPYGHHYSRGNFAWTIASGRFAGENLAKETPW